MSRPLHDEDSVLSGALSTRHLEAFSRKVTTTAGHLIGPLADSSGSTHYSSAMSEIHRELRQPNFQRRVLSFAHTSPTELVRSKLSTTEIQSRALSHLPDELLANVPENENVYSLFQGFQASVPEAISERRRGHKRKISHGQKLLEMDGSVEKGSTLGGLKSDRDDLVHRLEMMSVRKNMASSEIREIDNKIANLNTVRRIVLDRLAGLEQEEASMEHELLEVDNQIDDAQEQLDDAAALSHASPSQRDSGESDEASSESQAMNASFMSESIYEKLPSPKSRRNKPNRRKSMPILHEHIESGSSLKEIQAHNDTITALDFDTPFGTAVTAALDDTVRVWDLNAGRCMGLLEGHHASVRCLQVEDNIVATGSMDATIRLWDLNQADYTPQTNSANKGDDGEDASDDGLGFENPDDLPPPPPPSSMKDCPLFTLDAHVDEVTALHFRGDTLVSGSADKTLRQWDLQKGRCVQTLDVLWAAAQATATVNPSASSSSTTTTSSNGVTPWRKTGRAPDASADFVGALQCFDAALACGTADGMVRLWDLRSGQVHRSLVGHTGPVTCLQFDDVHLVTGSLDRSIRIWDLRTGSIHDAYAYSSPITSMQFDARRIVTAAGDDVVHIYDKTDGRQWDCGAGAMAARAAEEGYEAGGGGTAVPSVVERVRVNDGYLVEGRRDGVVGVWSC
ncbi:MAG: Mitochondrial fission protein [Piccolia ochrophora]|nr:MAG: Mitochondrial fission protein [Piccolia ochrophora]